MRRVQFTRCIEYTRVSYNWPKENFRENGEKWKGSKSISRAINSHRIPTNEAYSRGAKKKKKQSNRQLKQRIYLWFIESLATSVLLYNFFFLFFFSFLARYFNALIISFLFVISLHLMSADVPFPCDATHGCFALYNIVPVCTNDSIRTTFYYIY